MRRSETAEGEAPQTAGRSEGREGSPSTGRPPSRGAGGGALMRMRSATISVIGRTGDACGGPDDDSREGSHTKKLSLLHMRSAELNS
jgi:hypothetical protein